MHILHITEKTWWRLFLAARGFAVRGRVRGTLEKALGEYGEIVITRKLATNLNQDIYTYVQR